jgi:hypothetical protein
MRLVRVIKWFVICLFILGLVPAGYVLYRVWPRPMPPGPTGIPRVYLKNGKIGLSMFKGLAVAEVGDYPRMLQAYLRFDYLRSRPAVAPGRAYLCQGPGTASHGHKIFLQVSNNMLQAVPYLESLVAEGVIPDFALYDWRPKDLAACQEQSGLVDRVFRPAPQLHLYQIPDKMLIGPMADFLVFKSETDNRVLGQGSEALSPLTVPQARQLAQDILIISRFYSLPLGYFMAIGAMENNYISVNGDLDLAVWKRYPQPGDIVLKRRPGWVLVRNYSLGVWQITLDTLRYAQLLYKRDRTVRDYSLLPKGLRPHIEPDPEEIRPETLTTYAGLLFRHLLDRFHGNIMEAVGAYNGGPRDPNRVYAESVLRIERYARRVIVHAVFFPPTQTNNSSPSLHPAQ